MKIPCISSLRLSTKLLTLCNSPHTVFSHHLYIQTSYIWIYQGITLKPWIQTKIHCHALIDLPSLPPAAPTSTCSYTLVLLLISHIFPLLPPPPPPLPVRPKSVFFTQCKDCTRTLLAIRSCQILHFNFAVCVCVYMHVHVCV